MGQIGYVLAQALSVSSIILIYDFDISLSHLISLY